MCQAYGINPFHFVSQGKSIPANGSGETIAIVDAYHDRNLFDNVQTSIATQPARRDHSILVRNQLQ